MNMPHHRRKTDYPLCGLVVAIAIICLLLIVAWAIEHGYIGYQNIPEDTSITCPKVVNTGLIKVSTDQSIELKAFDQQMLKDFTNTPTLTTISGNDISFDFHNHTLLRVVNIPEQDTIVIHWDTTQKEIDEYDSFLQRPAHTTQDEFIDTILMALWSQHLRIEQLQNSIKR